MRKLSPFGLLLALGSIAMATICAHFKTRSIVKVAAFCAVSSLPLFAQDVPDTTDEPKTSATGSAERTLAVPVPADVIRQPPMTVGQKFTYHLKQSVDPWGVLRVGAGAALDQWRDHPGGWGQGWDMYGVRVASHFGQNLVKQQMLFAVQALDHENPLHLRSSRKGFKNRAIDAVRYTFVSNSDSGKPTPAYSRFIAAYGSAYVSRSWYPPSYHTVWGGISAGSSSLAIDVGMNLLREFGPDIKNAFRRH